MTSLDAMERKVETLMTCLALDAMHPETPFLIRQSVDQSSLVVYHGPDMSNIATIVPMDESIPKSIVVEGSAVK